MQIARCVRTLSLLLASGVVACGGASHQHPATTSGEHDGDARAQLWTSKSNPKARYIAALGAFSAQGTSVRPESLARARLQAAHKLQSFRDLELAPAHFERADVVAESTRRNILGVFLECGVTDHETNGRGTRIAVNVAVVDLRTEAILASVTGGATAPGPAGVEAEQLALEGALTTAMNGVQKLLASLAAEDAGSGEDVSRAAR